jgi:hypothetical protein
MGATMAVDDTDAVAGARRARSPRHWLVLGAAALGFVGLVLLGTAIHPDPRGHGTHEQLGMQPCMPMKLWNVPCPGCGVTTSVSLAMHGELWAAIRTQPFGFLVALCGAGFVIWAPIAHLCGRDAWADVTRLHWKRWSVVIAALAVLGWAYKLWRVRAGLP